MAAPWTTADYALIISICSSVLALFSLGWNVWAKFIFPKPRVQVTVGFCLVDENSNGQHTFYNQTALVQRSNLVSLTMPALSVRAVNHGPGEVHLDTCVFSDGGYLHSRKKGHHLMSAYSNYPRDIDEGVWVNDQMKSLIKAGEAVQLYFPVSPELLSKVQIRSFGFVDTFQRIHFCSRRKMKGVEKAANYYFSHVAKQTALKL